MKHCKSCEVEKPLSEFYTGAASCKVCICSRARERAKRARLKRQEKIAAMTTRQCKQCLKDKPVNEFPTRNVSRNTQARCSSCCLLNRRIKAKLPENRKKSRKYQQSERFKTYQQQYRQSSKGKEVQTKYRKNNLDKYRMFRAKRRAKVDSVLTTLSKSDKLKIASLYRRAKIMTDMYGTPYEVDHYFPVSRGGQHHPINLFIIPRHINRAKANKLPSPKFY